LEGAKRSLRNAPEDRRYDIELRVTERVIDE